MATWPYTDVGEPPDPRTLAWREWYWRVHRKLLRQCRRQTARALYVASGGNGPGTWADPLGTPAAGLTAAAALGGRCAVLLRCGDTWRESTALALSAAGVTLGNYGTGPWPVITRFTVQIAAGAAWTSAGSGAYYRTQAAEVRSVRVAGAWTPGEISYTLASSVVNCQATARSFFWDVSTSRLYVKTPDGSDPTTLALEACPNQTADGLTIADVDGCRVDGLSLLGFAHGSGSYYGVKVLTSGTNAAVIQDVDAAYTGYHSFGHIATTGGAVLHKRCRGAFTHTEDSVFVSYSASGGQVTLWHDCTVAAGIRPYTGQGFAAEPIYSHSGGTTGLLVCYGLRVPYHSQQCNRWIGLDSLPAAAGATFPANCRAFLVGHELGSRDATLTLTHFATYYHHTCEINGRIFVNYTGGAASGVFQGSSNHGWAINCDVRVIVPLQLMGFVQSTTATARTYNGRICIENASIWYAPFAFNYTTISGGGPAPDLYMRDTIYAGTGGTAFYVAINNNLTADSGSPLAAVPLRGNRYYGLAEGATAYSNTTSVAYVGNDPDKAELTVTPDADGYMPYLASQLDSAIVAAPEVEYDANWSDRRLQTTRWVGPYTPATDGPAATAAWEAETDRLDAMGWGEADSLDAASVRAAVGLASANLDTQLAAINAANPGVGDGDTVADHNTGGADTLRFVTVGGAGIDNAAVRAYLQSEYDANATTAPVRGMTYTGADGRWVEPLLLNAGLEYAVVITKDGYETAVAEEVLP